MKIIDTNIVLRYLLNDHEELSKKAVEIITTGEALILSQVVAEVVYVLKGVYNLERQEIVEALMSVVKMDNIHFENEDIINLALSEYASTSLDFVDTILIGYRKIEGREVITFDKKLNKRLAEI